MNKQHTTHLIEFALCFFLLFLIAEIIYYELTPLWVLEWYDTAEICNVSWCFTCNPYCETPPRFMVDYTTKYPLLFGLNIGVQWFTLIMFSYGWMFLGAYFEYQEVKEHEIIKTVL